MADTATFEIRDIDTAGRLYDRASVTRLALRSLLWASVLLFASGFLNAAFGPGENAPISRWPQILALPVLMTAVLVIATYSANYATGWISRVILVIVPVFAVVWCIEPILLANWTSEFGPVWLVSSAIRIPIVIWVSLEIGLGAVALISAHSRDLKVATEPAGIAAFIGAPPALGYLTRNRWWPRVLFVTATLVFAIAVMQLTQLNTSAVATAIIAGNYCNALSGTEQPACYQSFGWIDLTGQAVVWPLAFIAAVLVARTLRRLASKRTLVTASQAMNRERERPPVLFLRWFGNDHGRLAKAGATPLRFLLDTTISEPTIDRMLVETYSAFGPTVALGNPSDKKPKTPYAQSPLSRQPELAVWRDFPSNDKWQEYLSELAEQSAAIVMMVELAAHDSSESILTAGIAYELKLLNRTDLRDKTLFLLGSTTPRDPVLANRIWSAVRDLTGLPVPVTAGGNPHPLAAFSIPGGTTAIATSHRFTRSDYAMALSWFFKSRPAPDLIHPVEHKD